MILLDLLKKTENTVDFSAEGAECEAFLYRSVRENLEIREPERKDYRITGKIRAGDYKKLQKIAKKHGMKMRIGRKHGWYFFYRKNRDKIALLSGMAGAMLFVLFFNLFIWEVEVVGNKTVPTEEILSLVREEGIREGAFRKGHDDRKIEWKVMNSFDEIGWVSLNVQGSKATILVDEIKENPKPKPDDDKPVNLIASRYGVIRKMNVFDGQSAVKPGEAVMKGDLLVSAVYEDSHAKLTLKHARAEIIAETDYIAEVSFPMEQVIKEKGTLKSKITKIKVLGKTLTFGKPKENCFIEESEKDLYFLWIRLPITVSETQYIGVKERTVTYNLEQAKSGAYQLLKEKEDTDMGKMQIISRRTEEKVSNGNYIIKADYICLMDIAEEQDILSDIPWENTDDMS